ncbi:unnamed protein product [Rangifer tarandus platyrhynchus]|uniref:Uncharacterized protein n=1 Tax=Rangifer tarandus platyrhynchus TaxID=3082113 RepID=A0ABN9A8D5_RANTA|nr:unnamed protein product [Rangifer tarandus platyrhynchus]
MITARIHSGQAFSTVIKMEFLPGRGKLTQGQNQVLTDFTLAFANHFPNILLSPSYSHPLAFQKPQDSNLSVLLPQIDSGFFPIRTFLWVISGYGEQLISEI